MGPMWVPVSMVWIRWYG